MLASGWGKQAGCVIRVGVVGVAGGAHTLQVEFSTDGRVIGGFVDRLQAHVVDGNAQQAADVGIEGGDGFVGDAAGVFFIQFSSLRTGAAYGLDFRVVGDGDGRGAGGQEQEDED